MFLKYALLGAVTLCCILRVTASSGETILVPDDNGNPVEVLVQCPNYNVTLDLPNQVKFYLYRRFTNKTEKVEQMKVGGPVPTMFLPKRSTKILIPGFMSTLQSAMIQSLKKAYFSAGNVTNINVIAVDWAALAGSMFVRCYSGPQENSVAVGLYVARFIDYLVAKDGLLDLQYLHLIGHSLGAHVAGIAGANVTGTVNRITGLDPIGVGYCSINTTFVLDATDAKFVDVIHTDTQMLGMKDPCGHVDFYPWGGGHQDGCSVPTCSHSKAVVYFKESIETKGRYPAYACASLNHLHNIEVNLTGDKCETKSSNFMGEPTNIAKTGFFYTSRPAPSASSQLTQGGVLQWLLVVVVTIVHGQNK